MKAPFLEALFVKIIFKWAKKPCNQCSAFTKNQLLTRRFLYMSRFDVDRDRNAWSAGKIDHLMKSCDQWVSKINHLS